MKDVKFINQMNAPTSFVYRSLFFLIAFIATYSLSGTLIPSLKCDDSWQAVLEYATKMKFQFGRDTIFTYGPLGYLNTIYSQGYLILQRIIFSLFWTALVVWSATSIYRKIPGLSKYIFAAWFLVVYYLGGLDPQVLLVFTYGGTILTADIRERKVIATILVCAFSALALIKFTFFIFAVVIIGLCFATQLSNGRAKYAVGLVGLFVTTLIVLWLANSQSLVYLWPWIKGSFEITRGYTEAMSWPPDVWVFRICLFSVTLFSIALIIRSLSTQLNFSSAGFLLLMIVSVFLSWKMGLVRGDDHVFTFIYFLPVASSILVAESADESIKNKSRRSLTVINCVLIILCILSAELQRPDVMQTAIVNWPKHMANNANLIFRSIKGDWENCFESLKTISHQNRGPDLPLARSVIGTSSVDVINYYQWAALANDLNYRPRPVFQGYSVYTPYLQDLNLSFFKSNNRPRFILMNLDTIDFRYLTLDDASLIPFIFKNYELVAQDKGFLILQAKDNLVASVKLQLVQEKTISFDEILNMSDWNNAAMLLQVEIKPSLSYTIMQFIYQTPRLSINIYSGQRLIRMRFIPEMAKSGFLINPLLLETQNVVDFYQGRGFRAGGISFSKVDGPKWSIPDTIKVRLYKIE